MDLEDLFGDVDYGVLTFALIGWALACVGIWFGQSIFGGIDYPIWLKIIGSVVLLPIAYIVMHLVANK